MNKKGIEVMNEFLEQYDYPSDPTQAEIWAAIDSYTLWLTEQGFLQKIEGEA